MRFVVYVPDDGNTQAQALNECLEYVEKQHPDWRSAGVIVGRWPAVVAMVERGLAQVVLVAERAHLPPDRVPRVVSVEEEKTRPTERARGFLGATRRRPKQTR